REMERTFLEEPVAERYAEDGKLAAQRLDPGVILVDHEDTRRSCRCEIFYFHDASRMWINECGTPPNIGANATDKKTSRTLARPDRMSAAVGSRPINRTAARSPSRPWTSAPPPGG